MIFGINDMGGAVNTPYPPAALALITFTAVHVRRSKVPDTISHKTSPKLAEIV